MPFRVRAANEGDMTKIGEGGETPNQPRLERIHQEIDQSSMKFLNALETYQSSKDDEQKQRLQAIMGEQLGIIRSAVNELKTRGIYKQELKVEDDYRQYLDSKSPESFAALTHDIITLREYNDLP